MKVLMAPAAHDGSMARAGIAGACSLVGHLDAGGLLAHEVDGFGGVGAEEGICRSTGSPAHVVVAGRDFLESLRDLLGRFWRSRRA